MASTDGGTSDPLDPLVAYSSLALFPLSFKPQTSSVDDRNPQIPPLHSRLKAMVLQSPEKILKQAKTVLEDSLGFLKTDKTSATVSEDKTGAVFVTNDKDQMKRPALGLKRAKFSAKLMPRQQDVMLESSFDIDKYDDPEKFFAAYERNENANKELQRLRGQPLKELDRNLSSLPSRRRRPSLMGKSASYKHHSYSSTIMDDNTENLVSSQETFMDLVLSPARQEVPSETNAVVSLRTPRDYDSSTVETSKVNELDELLSCDYDGLDEDGVVNLLQEKLDIRLKDIGTTTIPDLCDLQPRKSVSSVVSLSKVNDSKSRLNGIKNSNHGAQLAMDGQLKEITVRKSPARSKSPLASISLLNRQISKRAPSVDPFSVTDIDSSSGKCSPGTQHGKQCDLGDARMVVCESQRSLVHVEDSTAVASPASGGEANDQLAEAHQYNQAATMEQLHHVEKSSVHAEESKEGYGRQSPLSEKIVVTDEPKQWVDGASPSDQVGRREDMFELLTSLEPVNGGVVDSCEDVDEIAIRNVDPTSEDKEQESQVVKDHESVQQKLNIEGSDMEKSTGIEVGCGVGEASIVEDICSEEPTKETRGTKRKIGGKKSKVPSQANPSKKVLKNGREADTQSNALVPTETRNKRRAVDAASGPRKMNELRRQSLYEAGTKWDAGLRRSSRIRMRPLEFWRGERFLYGRVHNSLVTVIGVKYASPSKEAAEQPMVKVKSFVSDEYKDKVEVAALY